MTRSFFYKMIRYILVTIFLVVFLIILPISNTTKAEEVSISDLLIPEIPSINTQLEKEQESNYGIKEERNLDQLLGPKDIFPFLPDNHRDSGTGKFNAF